MRRFVLVFMMVLLPLQWSWAAAASVCEHESGKAHFGHHEHQHGGTGSSGQADADVDHGDDSLGDHPDCQACQGIGAACVQLADERPAAWSGGAPRPACDRVLPEPPVESLLRPPLNLVA
jgi:hypothetical protein